jgi:hypothetical protein
MSLFLGFTERKNFGNALFPVNPMGATNFNPFLLNLFPGAAVACSLRLLRSGYTGPCIRVRRSSDNAELDIGFSMTGVLDTAALLTFVGASDGRVTTWYDQSGSNRNATQTTAANQPRIVTSGVLITENGKPIIDIVNSSTQFSTAGYAAGGQTSFVVFRNRLTGNNPGYMVPFCSTNSISIWHGGMHSVSTLPHENFGTPAYYKNGVIIPSPTRNDLRLQYTTNVLLLATTLGGGNASTLARLWQYPQVNWQSNTLVSEIILYNSIQTQNKAEIENNIISYYGL